MPIDTRDTLHRCLILVLKPVARFCLRRSLKLQDLLEAAKAAMLEVAEEEIAKSGSPRSLSRLSIMTGVHRRDVARLYSDEPRRSEKNLLTKIIGAWQQGRQFRLRSGVPKPLDFEGKESEFVSLVRSVSKDLNPYTVLFELERIGAVTRQGDKLHLSSIAYVPHGDALAGFGLLSGDADDLISSVEENILGDCERSVPNLHVKTEYDNICEEHVPEIRRWFLEQGQKLHEAARGFLSRFDRDLNEDLRSKKGGVRVAIGSFSIVAAAHSGGARRRGGKS